MMSPSLTPIRNHVHSDSHRERLVSVIPARGLFFGSGLTLLVIEFLFFVHTAEASNFRLIDEDGVVHLTNAPTDPRYQRLSGQTGTSAGWLRLPLRGKYQKEIQEASVRYGVDSALVAAVIRVESAFDPWAVSRKGAMGLMQLMPTTASVLGVRDAFNPKQNIDGGVRHLRGLIDRFAGDIPLALAAYNAGEEPVRWHRGIPPFPETQAYVRRIMQLYGGRGAVLVPAQFIYRYEDSQGTVTYTNIPPPSNRR
jgi:soluble lytic murein transglycosylase